MVIIVCDKEEWAEEGEKNGRRRILFMRTNNWKVLNGHAIIIAE